MFLRCFVWMLVADGTHTISVCEARRSHRFARALYCLHCLYAALSMDSLFYQKIPSQRYNQITFEMQNKEYLLGFFVSPEIESPSSFSWLSRKYRQRQRHNQSSYFPKPADSRAALGFFQLTRLAATWVEFQENYCCQRSSFLFSIRSKKRKFHFAAKWSWIEKSSASRLFFSADWWNSQPTYFDRSLKVRNLKIIGSKLSWDGRQRRESHSCRTWPRRRGKVFFLSSKP